MRIRLLQYLLLLPALSVVSSLSAQITGIKFGGDPCTEFTIELQWTGTSDSPYFSWNFDDPDSGVNDTITITGASFPLTNPTHTFSAIGVYNVCVSFQEPGMPVDTFCQKFNVGLCCVGVISYDDTCLENSIRFTIESDAAVNSVNWTFGDPTSGGNNNSTNLSPDHTFSSPGTYTVEAQVATNCSTFTIQKQITVRSCLTTNPLCEGTISFSDSCLTNGSTFRFNSTYALTGILWNFGDLNSGSNNTSGNLTPLHYFSGAGNFTVTFSGSASCGIITDTLIVYIDSCLPPPPCTGNLSIMDTCLENGSRFQVTSFYPINSVSWNFGDVSSGIRNTSNLPMPLHNFSDTGRFNISASVNAGCGVFNLTSTAEIRSCIPPPCAAQLISNLDTCLSEAKYFEIRSTYPVDSIKWDFGDENPSEIVQGSISISHFYSSGNRYTIQSIVYLSCGLDTLTERVNIVNCDSIYDACEPYLPNSFTPNDDGINEQYFAVFPCPYEFFELSIFNRWGQIVYESQSPSERWNGTTKTNNDVSGLYVYLIKYKAPKRDLVIKRGMVSVQY